MLFINTVQISTKRNFFADRAATGHPVRYGNPSVLEKGLHDALANDRERLAATIERFTERSADPTFGDAVLLDVGVLDAVQANSHIAREDCLVIVATGGIDAESIGKSGRRLGLGHDVNDSRSGDFGRQSPQEDQLRTKARI